MDRAADARVEQGRRVTAMDRADRIVMLRAWHALEYHSPRLGQDRYETDQVTDRRRRQFASADGVQKFEPAA